MGVYRLLRLVSLLAIFWHQAASQVCNREVPRDSRYVVNPTTYRGQVVVKSPTCSVIGSGFVCPFSHIFGDNEQVPPQPNLDGEDGNNDIGKFIVWRNDTTTPYVLTTLTSGTIVRAMNIEFLNYPAQNLSLPNLQLYESNSFITDPSQPSAQRIEFDMLNNSGLSQDDHLVTNISLIFTSSSNFILLYLNFTDVYNLDFFMVSELDLCTDTQPPVTRAEIDFKEPKVDYTDIIPTIEEFTANENVIITCTVSISGVFRWQWMQNGTLISNNDKFYIFTADGSRTSKLQLTGLSVSDAASYSCGVRHRQNTSQTTYVQILSFPVFVDVPVSEVNGYLDEREVALTCEVHGFLQSTNPPVWQGQDGSPIDPSSSKYVITSESSSKPSVLICARSVVSSFRSTLTIRQLSSEDAGRYTCVVDGNSSLIQLSIVPGTSPPLRIPATTSTATEVSHGLGCDCTQTAVVASVICSLITALIAVGVSVTICGGSYFIKMHGTKHTANEQPANQEGVYEAIEDKIGVAVKMKDNEAYGTATTVSV